MSRLAKVQAILMAIAFISIEIAIYLKWRSNITILFITAVNAILMAIMLEIVQRSKQ